MAEQDKEVDTRAIQTNVKQLHRQRGTMKRMITEFRKRLQEYKSRSDAFNVETIQASIDTLIERFNTFGVIQDQLEEVNEELEFPERLIIDTLYHDTIGEARQLIKLQQRDNTNENSSTNCASNTNGTNTNTNTNMGGNPPTNQFYVAGSIPVPKLTLPKFDGTQEKWRSFYSVFKSAIENNTQMSKSLKLYHLKTLVENKAIDMIADLDDTDDNFDEALKLLKDKYDNIRRLVRRHYKIMNDFPRLKKDTAAGIGELIDVFKQNIRALNNLGEPTQSWDVPIIEMILSKINQNTILQWELTLTDRKVPKFTDLLAYLEKHANCADYSILEGNQPDVKKNDKPQHKKGGISLVTTTTKSCTICGENHSIYKCDIFLKYSQDERYKAARKLNLCLNCLVAGHGAKACNSAGCHVCQKKHHTFLHRDMVNDPKTKDTSVSTQGTETQVEQQQRQA